MMPHDRADPPRITAKVVHVVLSRVLRQRSARGYFPFEGQWLTLDDITRRIQEQRRASWIIAGELILLLLALTGLCAFVLLLTSLLAY